MSKLVWGQRPPGYNEGVANGVLYFEGVGVPWNGLVSVNEQVSGTQSTDHYLDGRRLTVVQDVGDFKANIESYTYPNALDEEGRKRFGLSYRTFGSYGDEIHIVYNALIKTASKSWETISETPKTSLFNWALDAAAVNIPGARPASHLVIDISNTSAELIETIEGWLYGTATTNPRLPDPEEFVDIFEAATTLKITQNGDGTWTATGPDDVVQVFEDGSFRISAPTLLYLDEGVFTVDSF